MAGFFDNLKRTLDSSGGSFMGGKVKDDITRQKGFDKQQLQGFMKMAGSLASAGTRTDTTAKGFGPQFESNFVAKYALARAESKNTT